ncbi:MAG: MerR family transcriptional regulator [Ruminococcus sp.]
MYSIGTFSKLTKTTVATLRFYDKEGLLKPAYADSKTGYRYYLSSQLTELQKILSLRQIGVSIEQIKKIMCSENENNQLEKYYNELKTEISETQKKINIIQMMLSKEYPYDVLVKELDTCIIYSRKSEIKSNLQLYDFIQSTEKKIFESNPGLKPASPDYCFLKYLDNEYRSENMTVEYCQATNFMGKDTDDIVFKELPGCKVACLYFKGSNKYIGAGFTFLYDWINKSGYTPCDCPRECYIDGLWNVDSVDLWLTEIQIPIK